MNLMLWCEISAHPNSKIKHVLDVTVQQNEIDCRNIKIGFEVDVVKKV